MISMFILKIIIMIIMYLFILKNIIMDSYIFKIKEYLYPKLMKIQVD